MKRKYLTVLILFLVCSTSLFAQDSIRTAKDTIIGKVEEVGIDEIKYRAANNPSGPLIVIDKKDVIQIKYENGTSSFFAPDPYDVNTGTTTARKKTHSIKFEFFSPLGNDIAFGYETMLKVGVNLEFKLGIIGPGFKPDNENPSGLFVKAGVKLLTKPTYISRGVKYSHGLRGAYFKPELIFNAYSLDRQIYNGGTYPNYTTKNISYTNGAINIIFGMQHVLGDVVTIDYYAGLGYGFQTSSYKPSTNSLYPGYYEDTYWEGYCYSHTYGGPNNPIVLTGGVTLGVLF